MSDASEYKIGKPFDIADLRKPKPVRQPSPRDQAMTKAIQGASAAAESQVIPFYLPETEKIATAKAAAIRLIKSLELPVNVGVSNAHPHTLLFSRGVLSNRGKRAAKPKTAAEKNAAILAKA